MIARKIEAAVAILLVMIAASASFTFEAQQIVQAGLGSGSYRYGLPANFVTPLYFSITLLVAAIIGGCFYVLPLVRRQSAETGELREIAEGLRQRSDDLMAAAITDPLTGTNNRRFFDEALYCYLAEFRRIGRPVGLMVLDLDHFKSINDTYGHDVGDRVLRLVGQCLRGGTRRHDIVARMGGEEFAVIVPDMGPAELSVFGDRLRRAVQALPIDIGNVRLRITVSVGLAVADPKEGPGGLCKRADVNLYRAKLEGRNRICA